MREVIRKLKLVNLNHLKEIVKKKKNFKIVIFGSKEILGLECLVYNLPIFYQAIVVSDKAKIYKIDSKV